jgi:hypothetical protein
MAPTWVHCAMHARPVLERATGACTLSLLPSSAAKTTNGDWKPDMASSRSALSGLDGVDGLALLIRSVPSQLTIGSILVLYSFDSLPCYGIYITYVTSQKKSKKKRKNNKRIKDRIIFHQKKSVFFYSFFFTISGGVCF